MKSGAFIPEGYEIPKCSIIEKYEQSERGNRGHFVRLGITMDPEMIKNLKNVGAELQSMGYSDTDLSSLVRCACKEYLSQVEEVLLDQRHNQNIYEMNKKMMAIEDSKSEK